MFMAFFFFLLFSCQFLVKPLERILATMPAPFSCNSKTPLLTWLDKAESVCVVTGIESAKRGNGCLCLNKGLLWHGNGMGVQWEPVTMYFSAAGSVEDPCMIGDCHHSSRQSLFFSSKELHISTILLHASMILLLVPILFVRREVVPLL